MIREAMLYDRLPEARVRCHVCQWRCRINPGKIGVCRMRQNNDGVLYVSNYAEASSVAVDPIEKKPLYHFFPSSLVFSLGGWGCNFHCSGCQNWTISCVSGLPAEASQTIPPEQAIALTRQNRCQGIAWTYNEPTMWFEYTLDSARLAKPAGLYTVYVTNGYMTQEALDAIGPYLDAWRVDVKGFSDACYRKTASIPRWREILSVAKRAKDRWRMHVEVVTNVVPTLNDDDEQLTGIARWIAADLGELTPWHVTRFHPQHRLDNLPPTPIATLEKAGKIGKAAGLRFVYVGNVPGHELENTVCYNCGKKVIQRIGYNTRVVGVAGSRCHFCGAELNMRTE